MNRGERRRRNKIIWNRRAKLFYQLWGHPTVPCSIDELPDHAHRVQINKRYWRNAENWKEFQAKDPSMQLYKNTGTIWEHCYWNKLDRKRMNRRSRYNAKLDLRNSDETPFERYSLV